MSPQILKFQEISFNTKQITPTMEQTTNLLKRKFDIEQIEMFIDKIENSKEAKTRKRKKIREDEENKKGEDFNDNDDPYREEFEKELDDLRWMYDEEVVRFIYRE